MKYLVDTCGWIEWLTNGSLVDDFAVYLKQQERLVVPTIVQYELYKWVCREKGEVIALEVIGFTEQTLVVPLETPLAIYAAELSQQYRLAMADAIVYATSLQHNAELVTADKYLKDLSHVKYFEKKGK